MINQQLKDFLNTGTDTHVELSTDEAAQNLSMKTLKSKIRKAANLDKAEKALLIALITSYQVFKLFHEDEEEGVAHDEKRVTKKQGKEKGK